MKQADFINMLKVAHDVPDYYNAHWPYNLGYFDGTRYSFDCWNLIKVILAGWQPTGVIGSYTSPTVTGDIDGATMLSKCYNRSKDFSKISVPGTYLYISNSPHSGVYVGEFERDGYYFNVVECTAAWDNKVQFTYMDENGGRYQYKGGPKNPYGWTDYGLLPWVEYEDIPTDNIEE